MFSKETYTPREVAYMTGVDVRTVYRWIRTGKLRAAKLGQWIITRAALEEALIEKPRENNDNESV